MYKERIKRLRKLMQKESIKALLLTNIYDVRYLTGFTGSNGMLFVTSKKVIFFTDFRYKIRSAKEVKNVEIVIIKEGMFKDFIPYFKNDQLYVQETDILWGESFILKKLLRPKKLKRTSDIVANLRIIKERYEIKQIKKAISITEKVFYEILKIIKPGITEKDLALEIEFKMKKYGDMAVAFTPIVASGPNGALPHAESGNRKIKKGDMIVMDFGAKYNGYCADMTRTVVVGKANDKQKKIYNIVLEAQKKAIEYAKPGMVGKEIDRIARKVIENYGYGDKFGHSLGHGVGIEVHEMPYINPKNVVPLKEKTIFTVEPGIYIQRWAGVRIEDIVILDKDGAKSLNKAEKEVLIEL